MVISSRPPAGGYSTLIEDDRDDAGSRHSLPRRLGPPYPYYVNVHPDPDDIPDDISTQPSSDYSYTKHYPDDIALIPKSPLPSKPNTTTSWHKRTGEDTDRIKIWAWATLPLILHLASILTLLAIITTYINGHDFNLDSRRDPSTSTLTPLQSDITTAISSGIAIYRFFASIWSAAVLWRCTFILMGNGGISLEQIDRLLTWQVHFHPIIRLKSSQKFGLLISIILLASFPAQFSGPILTGSVTWSSSYRLSGSQRITDIHRGGGGNYSYAHPPHMLSENSVASGFVSIAWHDSRGDKGTMKRVIPSLVGLPVNSTLNNVTLPYFSVSKLDWVKEPMDELPEEVALALNDNSTQNPFSQRYFGLPNVFTMIPDVWGKTTLPSFFNGTVSETRTIFGLPVGNTSSCTPIKKLPSALIELGVDCVALGSVTYTAGAAECRDCRVSSPLTVQNDSPLTLLPSRETPIAISLMPMTGAMMAMQDVFLPQVPEHEILDVYVSELLIRSYAASWTYVTWITSVPNGDLSSTDCQIANSTSRATVLWWRVCLWLWLNLLFTASGLLFLVAQGLSGQRLVGSPPLAALLLDTSGILHKRDRALCDFSTMSRGDKDMGYLHFTRDAAQGGHRRVEIMKK